jgi:pyoverdine/dityrosine biosynthesis protein Dit1
MFKKVHEAGMDVRFHTDGHINDLFGDLIGIDVDVINSQVKVVGLD